MGTKGAYPTWSDMLALLGVFVVITVIAGLVFPLLVRSGSISEGFSMFLSYTVQFGVTIIYALYIKRLRTGGQKLLRFGFGKVNPAIILWGLVMLCATTLVIEPLLDLLPSELLDMLNQQMGKGGWMMLTAVAMAPLCEEILFRGILQDSLTRKFGPWRGILIASAIFGVVHIVPQQVINAFFVGIVLGYIYYRTQSLIPVIIIHALNNAISYFTWMIGGEKLTSTRQLIGNDTLYYIVYGIAWIVFLIAFFTIARTITRDQRKGLPLPENETAATDGKVSGESNNINPD